MATRAQVIRRRRIAGLIVVALILWGIYAGASALIGMVFGGGSRNATNVATCKPGTVAVTAYAGDGVSSVSKFDATTNPLIWFEITNTGKTSCSFNVGPKVQFYTIQSGGQTVWTSKQCNRSGLSDQVMVLKPGIPKKPVASEWLRVYSSGGGCGAGQLAAGPGTYTLTAEVNKVLSGNSETFELQ